MNRKEKDIFTEISALAPTFQNQLAVLPETAKVAEELKVIGFKGKTLNNLYLIWIRREDKEVYELKYTMV